MTKRSAHAKATFAPQRPNWALRGTVGALALLAGASILEAQEVTLRAPDGSLDLSGELLSFEDGVYEVRTILGAIKVRADEVTCEGPGCPGAAPTDTEVRLQAQDGSIDLTGEIVAFDGTTYRIETPFGILDIAAANTICIGAACPVVDRSQETGFTLAGAQDLAPELIGGLMAGFAAHTGSVAEVAEREAGPTYTFTGADGAALAEIGFSSQSTTDAVAALAAGASDLVATSRGLRSAEWAALTGPEGEVAAQTEIEAVLGTDAVIFAVHPDNPLTSLTTEEAAQVFSGIITDWADLGGAPGPITLIAPQANGGTVEHFSDRILTPAGAAFDGSTDFLGSEAEVARAVAQTPGALGLTSLGALGEAKALAVAGQCGIETQATAFTVKSEEYPLTRRLLLLKQAETLPEVAEDFIAYATSAEAQEILRRAGYIDPGMARHPLADQSDRLVATLLPSEAEISLGELQTMMGELARAERLSFTYRFLPGSAQLDSRAQADVRRLAALIQDGAFENQELLVVGFTDTLGDGAVNLDLSQAQAEEVMSDIIAAAGSEAAAGLRINALGFGEMSPLVCNDGTTERQINRRVEIWTRPQVATPAG